LCDCDITTGVYDSRSNKNTESKQNENAMIVSRVASEFIWNMNETQDSNKNRNEVCNTMEQHPNMLDML
jgi:hypothetical protein